MISYILKRLLLMIPTLFGVMLITFAVTQFVPGGPVEQLIHDLQGRGTQGEASSGGTSIYRGSSGLVDEALVCRLIEAVQGLEFFYALGVKTR